jgi:hypothetical protein
MRDYIVFWVCIAACVLGACYVLHRDLQAIATALTPMNEIVALQEREP